MAATKVRGNGEITPWTYKAILGAVAIALAQAAQALDRIATEYERRGGDQ